MPRKTALYLKSATMRWPRKQSKRRDLLSENMISLPLGDFRHLSHIGLDAQGDFGLSAFQRSGSLILHASRSHQDLYQNKTPTGTPPPPPKPPRLLSPEEMDAQAVNVKARSSIRAPRHKKCHSLPLLDDVEVVEYDGEPQREEAKVEVEEGGLRMRQHEVGRNKVPQQVLCPPLKAPVVEEDQSFALNLDLGPSILEDVLQVMDKLHQ